MNDWIKDLKVGDKVIISNVYATRIGVVEKITPAGNIKANRVLFNPNGRERGGDIWACSHLRRATPEAIKKIEDQEIINKAIKLMRETKNITVEQAKNIIFLLDRDERKKECEGE